MLVGPVAPDGDAHAAPGSYPQPLNLTYVASHTGPAGGGGGGRAGGPRGAGRLP